MSILKVSNTIEPSCDAIILAGVTRAVTSEVFLDPAFTYYCVPFSFISRSANCNFDFRLTVYSASSILIDTVTAGESIYRSSIVEKLHRELSGRQHKLLYNVAEACVLSCVHGEGCLYFVIMNGSSHSYLSLNLNVDEADGILPVFGKTRDTHDVPPRTQRLLVVLSRTGKTSNTTQVSFRYMSSIVPARGPKGSPGVPRTEVIRFGSNVALTLAGDLLTGTVEPSSFQEKGGDTIDTYLSIPQLGSV